MKTIIAVSNSNSSGKSTTILEVANLISDSYPNFTHLFTYKDANHLKIDFTLVIEVNGKNIAFESQGNPGTQLEARLDAIVEKYRPEVIFCTCDVNGETIEAVDKVAKINSYDTLYTASYKSNHSHEVVNRLKAEHLQDLVVKMGLL